MDQPPVPIHKRRHSQPRHYTNRMQYPGDFFSQYQKGDASKNMGLDHIRSYIGECALYVRFNHFHFNYTGYRYIL
jgi:hypothetical protein